MPRRSEFSDANLRVTMYRALSEVASLEAELDPLNPPEDVEASAAYARLVGLGCHGGSLKQLTFLYAFCQFAQEQNRQQEKDTRPEHRRLALIGLSWMVQDLDHHVSSCREMAARIERFLVAARVPGGDIRECADVWLYHNALPNVLRSYADFAKRIGRMTHVVRETKDQKLRSLMSLVLHAHEETGQPQFAALAALISGWQQRWPFHAKITEGLLRTQFNRAKSGHHLEPFRL